MFVSLPVKLPSPDIDQFDGAGESAKFEGLEKTAGQFDNKVPIAWFERGQKVSRAVARIITPGGLGTGWLINGGLVITNNHVISSASEAENCRIQFNYENDVDGNPVVAKAFDVEEMLATNADLDYTLLRPVGNPELEFGFFDISEATPPRPGDMNMQFPVVIQHPGGRKKEFSGFENELSHIKGPLAWYTSDTEPGSSGSPVLGGVDFRPFALHHAGGPHLINGQSKILNEGILLSAIIEDILANHPEAAAEMGLQMPESLLDDAAVLWLNRGRVVNLVRAITTGDEEVTRFESKKLCNAFSNIGGVVGGYDDIVALRNVMTRLNETSDREIVPVIVAAAGVAAGAAAAHWAHVTSKERLSTGSEFTPLGPTDFSLELEGFSFSGGGNVFIPGGSTNFGVGVNVEGFSIGGGATVSTPVGSGSAGFNIHVESTKNVESLYRGVKGLFDLSAPDQRSYFASVQPQVEALPILAAVFIAGVGAGAAAYKAGK